MRIGATIQAFRPVLGGAQRQLERLAPLLEARGCELDVVTRGPRDAPRRERIAGATVHRVGTLGGPRASLAYSLRGSARVVRLRPEVIHAHDLLSPSTIALVAHAATRAPIVVKVLSVGVGGDVDRLLRKPFGARRLALLSRHVAAFVCLSAEVEAELAAHGVPRERMRRIPNGVDASRFRPAAADERAALRARLELPADEQVALYCGRFYAAKRLTVLIDALRAAPGRLVLVGEGPEETALRAHVRAAGLEQRVELRPPVPDTAELMRAADVYVSASLSEGMSGSVLEAMASGTAVVAAPASGMAELIDDGAGELVGTNVSDFVQALDGLARDPARRAALGAAARERAQREYTLEHTADLLVALYRDVTAVRDRATAR
jgi:glycosyltransferase involved in cell wall biosynthesis